eukprot:1973213-Prorocentrum_lima.AAC.1
MTSFDAIVPCGIEEHGVTSMHSLLQDRCPTIEAVKETVAGHASRRFGFDVVATQVDSVNHLAEMEEIPQKYIEMCNDR